MKRKLTKKILFSKELLYRLAVVTLVVGGILNWKEQQFILILASGILLGAYYGLYNDMIWRPNGKLEVSYPYRAHQLWIHIICGTTGSVALYFLLGAINLKDQAFTLQNLGLREFVLFGLAFMGYVGLLPRMLWYFSYAQQNLFGAKG